MATPDVSAPTSGSISDALPPSIAAMRREGGPRDPPVQGGPAHPIVSPNTSGVLQSGAMPSLTRPTDPARAAIDPQTAATPLPPRPARSVPAALQPARSGDSMAVQPGSDDGLTPVPLTPYPSAAGTPAAGTPRSGMVPSDNLLAPTDSPLPTPASEALPPTGPFAAKAAQAPAQQSELPAASGGSNRGDSANQVEDGNGGASSNRSNTIGDKVRLGLICVPRRTIADAVRYPAKFAARS